MSPSRKLFMLLMSARAMLEQIPERDRAMQQKLIANYEEALDRELANTDTPPTNRRGDVFLCKRALLNSVDRYYVAKHRQLEDECRRAKIDAFKSIDAFARQHPQKGSIVRINVEKFVFEWRWGSQ
jgi:hypothetical protein